MENSEDAKGIIHLVARTQTAQWDQLAWKQKRSQKPMDGKATERQEAKETGYRGAGTWMIPGDGRVAGRMGRASLQKPRKHPVPLFPVL